MVSMLYHVYPTVVLLLISSFQDTTATDHICFRRLNIFNALLYYIMLLYCRTAVKWKFCVILWNLHTRHTAVCFLLFFFSIRKERIPNTHFKWIINASCDLCFVHWKPLFPSLSTIQNKTTVIDERNTITLRHKNKITIISNIRGSFVSDDMVQLCVNYQ